MQVAEVIGILESGRGVSYDGEAVDELTHALQCAAQAMHLGDPELIAAALLHDIGRAAAVKDLLGDGPHQDRGAAFCRPLFGDRVAWLVGSHVDAKRCLVSTQSGYAERLSPASLNSLMEQGGRLTMAEVQNFRAHQWAADALQLRRWDDLAKNPRAVTPALEQLRPILQRVAQAAAVTL